MERTEGEPDVVAYNAKTGEYIFYDCSAESPKGRRSLCYDREAWEARKQHKPENTAIDIANEMGIELLTEEEYRSLQELGKFDLKTSSWIKHLPVSVNLAEPFSVIAATIQYSFTITVPIPIMLPEDFEGY